MIPDLLEKYLTAKAEEALATAKRVEIGNQIAAELEHPDEGSKTHDLGDYKVTIKGVVNRRVDWEQFERLGIPTDTAPVKTKKELDVVGLKWWAEHDPKTYSAILRTITATPGRIQVEVKKNV